MSLWLQNQCSLFHGQLHLFLQHQKTLISGRGFFQALPKFKYTFIANILTSFLPRQKTLVFKHPTTPDLVGAAQILLSCNVAMCTCLS
jgi:hypothetical protein